MKVGLRALFMYRITRLIRHFFFHLLIERQLYAHMQSLFTVNTALEHPYFISFALVVVWAWPHLLMLPVWFGKDAYYRMDSHAREAVQHVRTNVVPGERPRRAHSILIHCFTMSLIFPSFLLHITSIPDRLRLHFQVPHGFQCLIRTTNVL